MVAMDADGLTCSDGSAAVGEPLAGSAPEAVAWVALEQNGPWGARAFTDSHLDPGTGAAIEKVAADHDVRPCLIRRPGRHADAHAAQPEERQLLIAHTRPGSTWLLQGAVASAEAVLDIDWSALRDGDLASVRRALPTLRQAHEPVLLVCTNAKRDVCCAVKGRPIALATGASHPGRVWEVTHTSGHRFAPTAVLLPAGTLHGRLDATTAEEVLRAAARGETVLEGARGRSTWPAPAQAAELAVRGRQGLLGLDELRVIGHERRGEGRWLTEVAHRDGRRWTVEVEAGESAVQRAESCGKALKPLTWFTAVASVLA
jgi:hypothetical protein